jgi:flagellar hook-associated protein 3 FlgL
MINSFTPTGFFTNSFQLEVQGLRERLASTGQEAALGRRPDPAATLGGAIGDAMLTRKALSDLETERGVLALRTAHLEQTGASLARLAEASEGMEARALSARELGTDGDRAVVAASARAALDSAFQALNVRVGERHLFSGDATDRAPLGEVAVMLADLSALASAATTSADLQNALDTYFNDPAGGFATRIYQGTPTASDPDAVTASDPAITGLIRGLAVIALSTPGEGPALIIGTDNVLGTEARSFSSARDALTGRRADLGLIAQGVDTRRDQTGMEEILLSQTLNGMTTRDPFAVASELQAFQTQLEASYLVTARLVGLSLVNFLR